MVTKKGIGALKPPELLNQMLLLIYSLTCQWLEGQILPMSSTLREAGFLGNAGGPALERWFRYVRELWRDFGEV